MTKTIAKLCVAVLLASAPLAIAAGCSKKKGRCTTSQKKKNVEKRNSGRCR